jgi:hypothetical protein
MPSVRFTRLSAVSGRRLPARQASAADERSADARAAAAADLVLGTPILMSCMRLRSCTGVPERPIFSLQTQLVTQSVTQSVRQPSRRHVIHKIGGPKTQVAAP